MYVLWIKRSECCVVMTIARVPGDLIFMKYGIFTSIQMTQGAQSHDYHQCLDDDAVVTEYFI